MFVLAILFNAPLKDIANPNQTPDGGQGALVLRRPPGAPALSQPMVAGVLIPGAALLWLFALPYIDRSKGWRIRDRKFVVIVFTVSPWRRWSSPSSATFFRGPGWSWVWPWQHLYAEL